MPDVWFGTGRGMPADRNRNEGQANLPTEHSASEEGARISRPDVDQERQDRAEAPARQGAEAADGRRRALTTDGAGSGRAQGLPRRARVRRRPDFERAYNSGVRVQGRYLLLFIVPNGGNTPRLGVAATRKLGSAVERNRAKRLARELFRRYRVAAGLDIIIVPRRDILDAPFTRLEADYRAALDRRSRSAPAVGSRSGGHRRGARRASRV
jgi:ribonuclease P protein component